MRGRASSLTQDFSRAIEDYSRVLRMEPGNLDVLICLGNAFSGLGQGDDAIETYNRVLEIAPGNAEAITRRGEEYQRKGELDGLFWTMNMPERCFPHPRSRFSGRERSWP